MKKQTENKAKSTAVSKQSESAAKAPSLFSYKKPWLWLTIAVVVAAVVLVAVFVRPAKTVELSDDLDAFVVSTLQEVHYSSHTEGKYPTVAYTALSVEEKEDTVTVYGVMMYREYTCTTQGALRVWGTANSPFAITAEKTDKGYTLSECWWPKSGQEYIPSIEKKFPRRTRDNAIDAQQYFAAHEAACKADAEKNIADADKYAVMQSDAQTLRVAYCPNNGFAFVVFSGGYNTDGTYVKEEGKLVFTFDGNTITLVEDGDTYVYSESESSKLPQAWKQAGSIAYFIDGTVFKLENGQNVTPEEKEETAPVGLSVTVPGGSWMDQAEMEELFGQYMVSNFPYDTDDVHYLPVMAIQYRGDLDNLLSAYAEDSSWMGLTAENFAQYDEAFFKDNYLMMTYYKNASSSCNPAIDSYVYVQDGDTLWLSVRLEVTKPAVCNDAEGEWLLFAGIAKEDFKKANALECYVDTEVTEVDVFAPTALSFTGTVKEAQGNAMLMETDDVAQFSSGVWVELGDVELTPAVGETYTVTYEDIVMPSLPPRITAVTITKP